MELQQVRSLINNLSYFGGNSYPYWQARMNFLLKMQGEQIWNVVEFARDLH